MKLRYEIESNKKGFDKFDHILSIDDDEYICCTAGIQDFEKLCNKLGMMDKEIKHTLSYGRYEEGTEPIRQVKYYLAKGWDKDDSI